MKAHLLFSDNVFTYILYGRDKLQDTCQKKLCKDDPQITMVNKTFLVRLRMQ